MEACCPVIDDGDDIIVRAGKWWFFTTGKLKVFCKLHGSLRSLWLTFPGKQTTLGNDALKSATCLACSYSCWWTYMTCRRCQSWDLWVFKATFSKAKTWCKMLLFIFWTKWCFLIKKIKSYYVGMHNRGWHFFHWMGVNFTLHHRTRMGQETKSTVADGKGIIHLFFYINKYAFLI